MISTPSNGFQFSRRRTAMQATNAYFECRDGWSDPEGDVEDGHIECWLHGSMFDLRTGKPTNLPATEPVATFPVDVRDGDVYVDTETTLNGVTPA